MEITGMIFDILYQDDSYVEKMNDSNEIKGGEIICNNT